jgi:hypothetical protein
VVTDHVGVSYGTAQLPATGAGLRQELRAGGTIGVPQQLTRLYQRFLVPRSARAELLRALADEPGFVWRGDVTDRAGRAGVAVTRDDATQDQELLVFDPRTGELLASESITTVDGERRVSAYLLILESGWTDTLG